MSLLVDLLFFVISAGVLIFAAEVAVYSMSNLAGYLRVNEFIVAFTLMAVATSIPEFFVGINSSLQGNGALTLGNVIGANLLNLTLVIGIPILISGGINIRSKEMKKDTLFMFIIAAMPSVLMLLGDGIGRIDGIILIATFIIYSWHMYKARKEFHKHATKELSHWHAVTNSLGLAAAIPILFFASNYAVRYASNLSVGLELPAIFVGLFIVSLGTTLPELMVGFKAARTNHHDIVMGDVIGSVVTNSTLVIGVAAIIRPIQADIFLFLTSTAFMLVAAFLFSTFSESGNKLYQKEGVSLILLYVLFLIVQLNLKGVF